MSTVHGQSVHVCHISTRVTAFTQCVPEMCANFHFPLTLNIQQLNPHLPKCVPCVTPF
jgi:hypothetical protein